VPKIVEVLLDYGLTRLEEFLISRIGFYDFIVVSRIHNMTAFNQVIKSMPDLLSTAKLIYDAEAVTAPREIICRELNGELVTEDEKYRLVEEEISIASLADSIICVSEKEAELYKTHGHSNTLVLGHSININPTPMEFGQRKDLLFVGALRDENSPNVDSLHWFVKEVFPLIVEKVPAIRLLVVGDNLAPSLSNLQDRNIEFLGRLNNISNYYDACRLFIAPTRFAAGIPHKVHEAASFGLPCVTTTLLAEQLDWQDGKQLLAADSAELFAEKCLKLYSDTALWQSIRSNAIKSVEDDCSSEKFSDHLLKLFE
jgi:glycosyltransferase involved in cell wall biosynthesis